VDDFERFLGKTINISIIGDSGATRKLFRRGLNMASDSEPIMGFGAKPQWGPGAKPLVGGLGDEVPQKWKTFL
jgi:hypothetical protein